MMTTTKRWSRGLIRAGAVGVALLMVACGAGGGGETASGEQEEVTLRLATTQTKDAAEHLGLWAFVDRLEKEAPWITVEYIGGPEAFAAFDTAEAVQTGALDMAPISEAYYSNLLGEAEGFVLSPLTPEQERESGALKLANDWHHEIGLHVLGLTVYGISFQLHFGPRYAELDPDDLDLSGMLIRGGPTQQPLIEALGGEVVNMPVQDIYTALERGTIDGFAAGNIGMYELGIAEPVQGTYVPTYLGPRYPLVMNQGTWDSLDEATQEALETAMIETEKELPGIYEKLATEEYERRAADGKVNLEPSDESVAEEFEKKAQDLGWDVLEERVSRVAELRDIYESVG